MLLTTHVANHVKVNSPRFVHPVLLHRILKNKKYNIEKAIKAFEEIWKWRMLNHIDAIILEDYSRMDEFRLLCPRSWYFNDKIGRPILIEQVGKTQFGEMFKVV